MKNPITSFASKPVICAMLALFAAPAHAQGEGKANTWYVTLESGYMILSDYCDIHTLYCTYIENAYGMSGGYHFHDDWAAEIGFKAASGFESTIPLENPQGRIVHAKADSEAYSISFGVRGTYFVHDHFRLTGKTGVHIWDLETAGSVEGGGSVSISDDGTKPYFGGGIQFLLDEAITIQGEYTIYKGDAVDASLLSGGLMIDF